MKSYVAKNSEMEKNWYVLDGNGKTVGRLATQIAKILRGKDKPTFTPHADNGDFVIVLNAEKVSFSGKKWQQKNYYWHTGYPGGTKTVNAATLLEKEPEEILRKAVWGMLPKNKWQKKLIQRLKVYTGSEHPHVAQQPEVLEV